MSPSDLTDQTSVDDNTYGGHYSLKGMVGHGGVGKVYLAKDASFGREVAIKELDIDENTPNRERKLKRFMREARITAQLEHPGVVPVYDLGEAQDGKLYYVMKYVRGKTLYQAIKGCKSTSKEEAFRMRLKFLDALISVCEAVAYAHAKGIIHRDLKPGNIVLGEFGESIILDWGLARKVSQADDSVGTKDDKAEQEKNLAEHLTRQGAIMGTPSYMPPEQAGAGLGEVDERSDVYSLGAILFFILTGEKIYQADAMGIIEQLKSDEPTPSPRLRCAFIPPDLKAICEKATSKDRSQRFANAGEMADELKAYRDGRLVSVYAYSKRELLKRFIVRNKAAVVASMLLIVAIISGGAFSVHYAIDAHRARLKAERALVDVTTLSQEASRIARESSASFVKYFDALSDDMNGLAKVLGRKVSQNDKVAVEKILGEISRRHPEVTAFVVGSGDNRVFAARPAGIIDEVNRVLSELEKDEEAYNDEKAIKERVLNVVKPANEILWVPMAYKEAIFAAIFDLNHIIPAALPVDPKKSPFQVWCMQDDGTILYDEDPNQVGKSLFTDAMFESFPELKKFGEQMREEPWGTGYYSFYTRGEEEKVIYKVAAWDTVSPLGQAAWKVVVTHPYFSR